MKTNFVIVLTIITFFILILNACGDTREYASIIQEVIKAEITDGTEPARPPETAAQSGAVTLTEAGTIDLLTDVDINGSRQKLLIQSDDLSNPILLYIHGGPGDPAMMFSHLYSDSLKRSFIFVNWDQRGSGLSWQEGMAESEISEDQIYNDALELSRHLIKKYKKDKIYILGHSFGSIIGLKLAYRHPELFHAYIGMGQVLDWNRSVGFTKKWLKNKVLEAGDDEGLKRLESVNVPPMDMVIQYGGHTHTPVDFDSIMKASPYYFEGYIDLKNKARDTVQKCVARNGSSDGLSLIEIKELKVPVYFFEGRYDHVTACAPELILEFFDKLQAPVKEIVWFENSAHLPNLEEPELFQQMLIERVLHTEREPVNE